MSRSIPDRPHPDFYKNEAKALLKALRAGEAEAMARWRAVATPTEQPALHDAQRVIAREHDHPSWPRFIAAVLDRASDQMARADFIAALRGGQRERVRALLERSPWLANADGPGGATPLHLAADSDDPEIARMLLEHGADLDALYGKSAHNALSWAATLGSFAYAQALVDGGCELDLFCAAGLGKLDMVERFFAGGQLAAGASRTGSSRYAADGTPLPRPPSEPRDVISDALYIACRGGFARVAAFLLERGADPDFRAFCGGTCLHWAYFSGDPDTVALIDRSGADRSARDYWYGALPRDFSMIAPAAWGLESLVRRRLVADPSLAQATSEKGTALALAEAEGHIRIVALLRAAASDPGEIFVQACVDGDLIRVQQILGAAPALANAHGKVHPDHREHMARVGAADGWSALHLAAHYGHRDVVEALLAAGADVDAVAQNAIGNTPLMAALAGGRLDIARVLLERGADPRRKDRSGLDALAVAGGAKDPALAELVRAFLGAGDGDR